MLTKNIRRHLVLIFSLIILQFSQYANAALRDDDLQVIEVVSGYVNLEFGSYELYSSQATFGDRNGGYGSIVGYSYVTLLGNDLIIDYDRQVQNIGPYNYLFIHSPTVKYSSAISLDGSFSPEDIAVYSYPSFTPSGGSPGIYINLNKAMLDHSIIRISAVPEMKTWFFWILGMATVCFSLRKVKLTSELPMSNY